MKLLIFSDAHGQGERIQQVIDNVSGVDYLLYAGDKVSDLDRVNLPSQIKVEAVPGNRDFEVDLPHDKIIKVANKKIFITHGDRYQIKWGLDKLYYKAKEVEADIVIFGHNHSRLAIEEGGILFFNPGSISLPRDKKPPSYGMIEIEGQQIKYQHYDFNY